MVDEVFVDVPPERGVPILVLLLVGHGGQHGGGVHGFGERPVHAVGDHGAAVPVGGVSQAHGAVGVPGVLERASEQVFGGVDQRGLLLVGAAAAGGELGDQAGPFDAVAGRGAVRLELVVGLAAVEL